MNYSDKVQTSVLASYVMLQQNREESVNTIKLKQVSCLPLVQERTILEFMYLNLAHSLKCLKLPLAIISAKYQFVLGCGVDKCKGISDVLVRK